MFRWFTRLYRKFVKGSAPQSGSELRGECVYELPYEPGRRYRVIQGYGGTFSHSDESRFSIDFGMPVNTPICAARSGIVFCVRDHFSEGGVDPSFKEKGNAIYVLHNDDTVAAYVHLTHGGACVRAGDFVNIGDIIGLSGNTGWSSRPHLHFHVEDALDHKRMATLFNTSERGVAMLEANNRYTRPLHSDHKRTRPEQLPRMRIPLQANRERDPFTFVPELLNPGKELASDLSMAGFEVMSDYASIDAMHDVHGLEVCGISNPNVALEITRLMLRRFPGWNAGWLHAPDNSCTDAWVARIQRDHDDVMEYRDIE